VAAVTSSGRGFGIIAEAVADEPGPDDAPFRQMYVQVGAFAEHSNAAKLTQALQSNGFRDSFIVSGLSNQDRLHRVRIGPLRSAEQFDDVNDGLRAMGLNAGRLVVEN
jgi:rare lipoprotein A